MPKRKFYEIINIRFDDLNTIYNKLEDYSLPMSVNYANEAVKNILGNTFKKYFDQVALLHAIDEIAINSSNVQHSLHMFECDHESIDNKFKQTYHCSIHQLTKWNSNQIYEHVSKYFTPYCIDDLAIEAYSTEIDNRSSESAEEKNIIVDNLFLELCLRDIPNIHSYGLLGELYDNNYKHFKKMWRDYKKGVLLPPNRS